MDESGESGIWVLRKMNLWWDAKKGRQTTLAYDFEESGIEVRAFDQVNNLEICVNLELSTAS
jgi:hypothetical protein